MSIDGKYEPVTLGRLIDQGVTMGSQYFDTIATVVQAVAVAATAVVAIRSMNAWRSQQVGKRRMEIAEEALTTFYEVQAVMTYVRNGMSSAGKAFYGKRTPEGQVRDELSRRRDGYFVPIQRLTDKADLFARLQSLEHKFTAYFGSESKDVFEAVWSVRAKVHSSARMLIETAADERADRPDNKSIQDWQNDIWYGLVEGDELSKKIAGVVEKMEKICAPHLK